MSISNRSPSGTPAASFSISCLYFSRWPRPPEYLPDAMTKSPPELSIACAFGRAPGHRASVEYY